MNIIVEIILTTWFIVLLALIVDDLTSRNKSCVASRKARKEKCKDCHKDE